MKDTTAIKWSSSAPAHRRKRRRPARASKRGEAAVAAVEGGLSCYLGGPAGPVVCPLRPLKPPPRRPLAPCLSAPPRKATKALKAPASSSTVGSSDSMAPRNAFALRPPSWSMRYSLPARRPRAARRPATSSTTSEPARPGGLRPGGLRPGAATVAVRARSRSRHFSSTPTPPSSPGPPPPSPSPSPPPPPRSPPAPLPLPLPLLSPSSVASKDEEEPLRRGWAGDGRRAKQALGKTRTAVKQLRRQMQRGHKDGTVAPKPPHPRPAGRPQHQADVLWPQIKSPSEEVAEGHGRVRARRPASLPLPLPLLQTSHLQMQLPSPSDTTEAGAGAEAERAGDRMGGRGAPRQQSIVDTAVNASRRKIYLAAMWTQMHLHQELQKGISEKRLEDARKYDREVSSRTSVNQEIAKNIKEKLNTILNSSKQKKNIPLQNHYKEQENEVEQHKCTNCVEKQMEITSETSYHPSSVSPSDMSIALKPQEEKLDESKVKAALKEVFPDSMLKTWNLQLPTEGGSSGQTKDASDTSSPSSRKSKGSDFITDESGSSFGRGEDNDLSTSKEELLSALWQRVVQVMQDSRGDGRPPAPGARKRSVSFPSAYPFLDVLDKKGRQQAEEARPEVLGARRGRGRKAGGAKSKRRAGTRPWKTLQRLRREVDSRAHAHAAAQARLEAAAAVARALAILRSKPHPPPPTPLPPAPAHLPPAASSCSDTRLSNNATRERRLRGLSEDMLRAEYAHACAPRLVVHLPSTRRPGNAKPKTKTKAKTKEAKSNAEAKSGKGVGNANAAAQTRWAPCVADSETDTKRRRRPKDAAKDAAKDQGPRKAGARAAVRRRKDDADAPEAAETAANSAGEAKAQPTQTAESTTTTANEKAVRKGTSPRRGSHSRSPGGDRSKYRTIGDSSNSDQSLDSEHSLALHMRNNLKRLTNYRLAQFHSTAVQSSESASDFTLQPCNSARSSSNAEQQCQNLHINLRNEMNRVETRKPESLVATKETTTGTGTMRDPATIQTKYQKAVISLLRQKVDNATQIDSTDRPDSHEVAETNSPEQAPEQQTFRNGIFQGDGFDMPALWQTKQETMVAATALHQHPCANMQNVTQSFLGSPPSFPNAPSITISESSPTMDNMSPIITVTLAPHSPTLTLMANQQPPPPAQNAAMMPTTMWLMQSSGMEDRSNGQPAAATPLQLAFASGSAASPAPVGQEAVNNVQAQWIQQSPTIWMAKPSANQPQPVACNLQLARTEENAFGTTFFHKQKNPQVVNPMFQQNVSVQSSKR